MKTYLFASSRKPSITYRTTAHDNGAITCDCPARVECWHIKRVRLGPVGRQEKVLSYEDRRLIVKLLAEGNEAGAREAAITLFPSLLSEEEISDVLQEAFDEGLEEYYDAEVYDEASRGVGLSTDRDDE